eukprot:scaffold82916_cov39-Phaeocystis_antarctica.AAC.2
MNPKPTPNQGAPPRYKRTLKVLHAVVRGHTLPSYHPHYRTRWGATRSLVITPITAITVAALYGTYSVPGP